MDILRLLKFNDEILDRPISPMDDNFELDFELSDDEVLDEKVEPVPENKSVFAPTEKMSLHLASSNTTLLELATLPVKRKPVEPPVDPAIPSVKRKLVEPPATLKRKPVEAPVETAPVKLSTPPVKRPAEPNKSPLELNSDNQKLVKPKNVPPKQMEEETKTTEPPKKFVRRPPREECRSPLPSHMARYKGRSAGAHTRILAALAIEDQSYTLTNGVQWISVDVDPDWYINLAFDVYNMNIKRLYVVDEMTGYYLKKHVRNISATIVDVPLGADIGRCMYCQQTFCHRWRAVVGGIQRILEHNMSPIRH